MARARPSCSSGCRVQGFWFGLAFSGIWGVEDFRVLSSDSRFLSPSALADLSSHLVEPETLNPQNRSSLVSLLLETRTRIVRTSAEATKLTLDVDPSDA